MSNPFFKRAAFLFPAFISFGGLFLAYFFGTFPEDAYINFRYAQHLAEGHGPVWNTSGNPVEGYTSFLWIVLLAPAWFFNFEFAIWVQMLSFIFLAGTLFISALSLHIHLKNSLATLLGSLLIGSHFSLLFFSFSGMETALFSFLLTLLFYLSFISKKKNFFLLGLTSALLIMTRPEGLIFSFLFLAFTLFESKKLNFPGLRNFLISLFIPISIWLIWKIRFYGDILPNTFYVKTAHSSILNGAFYIYLYFKEYFIVGPFIGTFFLIKKKEWPAKIILALGSMIVFWLLYMIAIGGDYMEFRMMAPLFPIIVLFSFLGIKEGEELKRAPLVFIFIIMAMGNLKAFYGDRNIQLHENILNTGQLANEVNDETTGTAVQGKMLFDFFGDDTTLVVAIGAAGAIPFYWNTHFIDASGLNDKEIAEKAEKISQFPGHFLAPSWELMLEKKVNLIYPRLFRNAQEPFPLTNEFLSLTEMKNLGAGKAYPKSGPRAQLLQITLSNQTTLGMIYLFPHPHVEQLLALNSEKIRSSPIQIP